MRKRIIRDTAATSGSDEAMARRFLVTGGAGYVGSHLVAALVERGDTVVVLDNLRTGHRGAVPPGVQLIVADLADTGTVDARAGRRSMACGVPLRGAVAGRREHAAAVPLPDRQRRQRHAPDRGLCAPRHHALRPVLDGGVVRHAKDRADPGRRAARSGIALWRQQVDFWNAHCTGRSACTGCAMRRCVTSTLPAPILRGATARIIGRRRISFRW